MVAGFAGVTEVAALRWIPVAAGAGVLVAYDDRVVALDGPTGAERWHHRWVGADVLDLAATPMAASPWPGSVPVGRARRVLCSPSTLTPTNNRPQWSD